MCPPGTASERRPWVPLSLRISRAEGNPSHTPPGLIACFATSFSLKYSLYRMTSGQMWTEEIWEWWLDPSRRKTGERSKDPRASSWYEPSPGPRPREERPEFEF